MSLQQDLSGLLKLRIVQLTALTALIVSIGTECFLTKLSVLDLDVWWHLSVGNWILQHHSFPHSGILSRTAADRPWMAYSWGYEVLLARAYDSLGFLGMALFGTALTVAVALVILWRLKHLSGSFWTAWILTALASAAFLFNIMPRPVFFSMMLYTVVLGLLLHAQRSGNTRQLYWLPFLFLLWGNLHIQFVYGLFALGLLVGLQLVHALLTRLKLTLPFVASPRLPLLLLLAILAASVCATCVGPYSFHLYGTIFGYSQSKVFYATISELQALSFEGITHYLELLLAAAAFFALGWRQKLDPFKLLLLAVACVFAFRTARDAWFLCITAGAVLADFGSEDSTARDRVLLPEVAGVIVASALLLFLVARNTDFDTLGLDRAISNRFPVHAANFVLRNPVPGPLYNSFDWGGFLIFYLPQYPVAIDGRGDLYGDELTAKSFSTENADASYVQDPAFNEANLLILKSDAPLAQLLSADTHFRLLYRDEIATVLARN